MKFKKIIPLLKKHWVNALLIVIALIVIFIPGAKSRLLQQFISLGFFNVGINKQESSDLTLASNFSFINQQGGTTTISQLKGKVIFINFWASWCPPCLAEMPSLDQLYRRFKDDKRMVFVFINEDDDKSKALRYLDQNKFLILLESRAGEVQEELYNGTLPTTIVINKAGKVVLHHTGMGGYNTDKFIKELEEMLNEKGSQ